MEGSEGESERIYTKVTPPSPPQLLGEGKDTCLHLWAKPVHGWNQQVRAHVLVCVCWMLPWQHTAPVMYTLISGVTMATSHLTCLGITGN